MKKGISKIYAYIYPRYFVFDQSLLPDDFSINDDYSWDEETGRLIEEDGSDYYRGFFTGQGRFSETQDAKKIEWLNEAEPLGIGQYKLFPLLIGNERDELNAAVNHLRIIDKIENSDSQSTLTVKIVLDYQLDQQPNPKEFLAIVKRCITEFACDSIVELRLKKKLVSWHDEKLAELDSLLNPIQESLQKAEESLQQPAMAGPTGEHKEETAKTDLRLQMLTMYYLRKLKYIETEFHDLTKVASIFSVLLGKNKQNIRAQLRFDKLKFLESDLETLLPLFEDLGQQADEVVKNMKMNLTYAELDPNNKRDRAKSLNTNKL